MGVGIDMGVECRGLFFNQSPYMKRPLDLQYLQDSQTPVLDPHTYTQALI